MERIYNDNNIKLYKLMALSGAISPIDNSPVRLYNHPRRSPDFDSRANSNVLCSSENLDSPIVRFYRSGSPLSAIENLEILPLSNLPKTVFKTPVKVEEDVLVMDGILVGPVTGRRVRSSSSIPDTGGSSSSGGKSLYKTEICRSWEDFGSCRYGAKCQFAHGKEELRPVQFFNKSKLQTQICRSYSSGSCSYDSKGCFIHQQNNSPASGTDSPFSVTSLTTRTMSQNNLPASATDSPTQICRSYSSGSCSYDSKGCFIHQQTNSPASGTDSPFSVTSLTTRTTSQNNSPASATDSPVSVIPSKTLTVSPITLEKAINWAGSSSSTTRTVSPIELQNAMNSSESSCFTFASTDWSPLDDGIEVALPCSSSTDKTLSREEVDAYITSVLYGSNKRKTLPVFAAICPR